MRAPEQACSRISAALVSEGKQYALGSVGRKLEYSTTAKAVAVRAAAVIGGTVQTAGLVRNHSGFWHIAVAATLKRIKHRFSAVRCDLEYRSASAAAVL